MDAPDLRRYKRRDYRGTAQGEAPAAHLHQAMELVYVIKGSLELGVGLELYHMEEGDIGLVFPDVIHHYQVFSEKTMKCCILMLRYGSWRCLKNY